MHHSQIEIERKYDVDENTTPPRLVGTGAVALESEPSTTELVAVYVDTADLALARQSIAVRVRRGGADEGWHVKLPADEGRTEMHWPLGDGDQPPADLVETLHDQVGDASLEPIARVTNRRTTTILQDAAGFAIAELCDDHVDSQNLRTGDSRSWREWEVELLSGAPDTRKKRTALLDEIEGRLLEAGAVVSPSSSKLARTLGL
jgi:inorganic triphosphatase YgiF